MKITEQDLHTLAKAKWKMMGCEAFGESNLYAFESGYFSGLAARLCLELEFIDSEHPVIKNLVRDIKEAKENES